MLAKYTLAGLTGSVLLATVAFAQTPTTPSDSTKTMPSSESSKTIPSDTTTTTKTAPASTADTTAASYQGDWRASKIPGLNVYNDKNESVGEINDLLTDKSGSIKAVVIGVGGFLGVGEHLVAVPFDKVKFVNEPVSRTEASTAPAGSRPASTTTGAATTTTSTATTTTTMKANSWYPDHAVYNATKDELKAMPEFKYSAN